MLSTIQPFHVGLQDSHNCYPPNPSGPVFWNLDCEPVRTFMSHALNRKNRIIPATAFVHLVLYNQIDVAVRDAVLVGPL